MRENKKSKIPGTHFFWPVFTLNFVAGVVGGIYGLGGERSSLLGMAGMYLGARLQKFVPTKAIKWMLAGVIVVTAAKYVAGFFGL